MCHSDGEQIVLRWPTVAFSIRHDAVDVDGERPRESAEALLVPVWSFVLALHDRGALHGSVVSRDGRAVAVLGDSGSGKSTIAARAIDDGWELVADDLASCSESGQMATGQAFTRLLPDRARVGTDPGQLSIVADQKSRRPTPLARSATLAAVVVMGSEFPRLARLAGIAALDAVLSHRYIPFVAVDGQRQRDLDGAARIVRSVPVYGAPPRSLTVAQLVDAIDGIVSPA